MWDAKSMWGDAILEPLLERIESEQSSINILEQREFNDLDEVIKNGGEDIIIDELRERYDALSKKYGKGVLIDIIRRVIPSTIANEIVGIQPMTRPTGTIFSMRAKYKYPSLEVTDDLSA